MGAISAAAASSTVYGELGSVNGKNYYIVFHVTHKFKRIVNLKMGLLKTYSPSSHSRAILHQNRFGEM